MEAETTAFKKLVRVGTVSSVDVEERTARVKFADMQDAEGKPLISGPLKILQNQPLITVEQWVTEVGAENKWDCEAQYASVDRNLGLGESYTKSAPDVIKTSKTIQYEKTRAIGGGSPISHSCPISAGSASSCPLEGVIDGKTHRQTITVHPWLPYIEQLVVCLFVPNGNGDGFVMGGI